MAAKLRISPAAVTRENADAATGSSASSAQTVAASSPAGASSARIAHPPCGSGSLCAQLRMRGTPTRIPSVAPNVRRKPVSANASGAAATRQMADSASVLSGDVR